MEYGQLFGFQMSGSAYAPVADIRAEPWKASGCIRFAKSNRINFNQSSRYKEGSLTAVAAGEQVVPASELASAMKQIKELQRLLGKKTMENELLKEAVEYGRQKKWIAHVPLLPEDGK